MASVIMIVVMPAVRTASAPASVPNATAISSAVGIAAYHAQPRPCAVAGLPNSATM